MVGEGAIDPTITNAHLCGGITSAYPKPDHAHRTSGTYFGLDSDKHESVTGADAEHLRVG